MRFSSLLSAAASLLLVTPLISRAAGPFPDAVGHRHEQVISAMVEAGVLKGYPDGKFYPDKEVNRAEMATIISRAIGFTPPASLADCYSDVKRDQWYAPIICSWSSPSKGILTGYNDGLFRPNNTVSRVEALAMISRAMRLPAPDVTDADQSSLKQSDIAMSAWYAKYVVAAYKSGMLPIPGQDGLSFYPAKALLRGEAAAYVVNALKVRNASSSSVSSVGSVSSSTTNGNSSVSSSVAADDISSISVPAAKTGQFSKRKTKSYSFSLSDAKTTISIQTSITGFYVATVTCRLYLLDSNGFSNEYYLGVQDGQSCTIKATVPRGNYQLQLQPSANDAYFALDIKSAESDGNDGLLEAVPLAKNGVKTGVLEAGDVYDVYSFTVALAGRGQIQVTSTANPKLQTVIYLPADFDQYGFKGPEEGVWYDYQPGTYYILIAHTGQLAQKQTYTVNFKWQQ